MKKILLLVTALFIICSCSTDDSTPRFHVEIVPIASVALPRSFTPGRSYEIKAKYMRPTACHIFDRFHYDIDGNVVTMSLQTLVLEDNECKDEPITMELEDASFYFNCPLSYQASSYVFRFYSGQGINGEPMYMEQEVVVRN